MYKGYFYLLFIFTKKKNEISYSIEQEGYVFFDFLLIIFLIFKHIINLLTFYTFLIII